MEVANYDFESWASSSNANSWGEAGTVSQYSANPHGGTYAAELAGGSSSYVTQAVYDVHEGDSVNYTLWWNEITNTVCTGQLNIIFRNSSGVEISTSSVTLDTGLAAGNWKQFSGSFIAPAGTDRISIQVVNIGALSSYHGAVDDVLIWVDNKPISSDSETFDYGVAVSEFSYTPSNTAYFLRAEFDNIDWSGYSDNDSATATINSVSESVSDSEGIITFSYTFTASTAYDIEISKLINNGPEVISPVNGESIPIEEPFNTVNFEWENISSNYIFQFGTDSNFDSLWYNISQSETTQELSLNPGTYYWRVLVWDSDLSTWGATPVSFTIEEATPTPGYVGIFVKNEDTLVNLTSFSVILQNDTNSYSKSTSSGVISFNSSEVLTGEYIATISSSGYSPRTLVIDSPDIITAYLSSNTSTSLISFSLIDYTNQFSYLETRLKITKPDTGDGITISDSYFDASGSNKVYLTTDTSYSLELISSTGYTRGVGSYTPVQDETVSLIAGDVELIPASDTYGGFNYTFTKTNESITLNWFAPAGSLTEPFSYTIYDDNSSVVYSLSSSAPAGSATYYYADPSKQYKIVIEAETTGGTLRHTEYVRGENSIIDLGISDKWSNMISVFILFTIGLLFGAKSASAGAFITAIFAGGLYAVGMLHIGILILSMIVVLGLIAILRGRYS
ncbi:hypothetical protein [Methanosarcina acetivorans]|nr:hypothetical protein [Methanosarcina acetivorans]